MTNDWRQPHQIKEDNFNQKIKYDDSLNKNEDNKKQAWAELCQVQLNKIALV